MTGDANHASTNYRRGGFSHSVIIRIRSADPVMVMRKIMWNIVLLLLGLFMGFIVIQHAMFYSFPPNLSEFLYVQKEVYIVFSVVFVFTTRTLLFVETKIRGLAAAY